MLLVNTFKNLFWKYILDNFIWYKTPLMIMFNIISYKSL